MKILEGVCTWCRGYIVWGSMYIYFFGCCCCCNIEIVRCATSASLVEREQRYVTHLEQWEPLQRCHQGLAARINHLPEFNNCHVVLPPPPAWLPKCDLEARQPRRMGQYAACRQAGTNLDLRDQGAAGQLEERLGPQLNAWCRTMQLLALT